MIIETNSEKETWQLGYDLAVKAQPGDIVTLTGDLGTGKTVLAQGFAQGLGVDDYVNSPTFTIVQVYEEGRLPFYHFDVYRIADPDEIDEIGFDEYVYGDGVSLIEWAELLEDRTPRKVIRIVIEKDPSKGFDYRRVTVEDLRTEKG